MLSKGKTFAKLLRMWRNLPSNGILFSGCLHWVVVRSCGVAGIVSRYPGGVGGRLFIARPMGACVLKCELLQNIKTGYTVTSRLGTAIYKAMAVGK